MRRADIHLSVTRMGNLDIHYLLYVYMLRLRLTRRLGDLEPMIPGYPASKHEATPNFRSVSRFARSGQCRGLLTRRTWRRLASGWKWEDLKLG